MLTAVTPAFALVFGHFMLRDEPFTFKALGAIAIGIAGVAIISADQLHVAGRQALLGCAGRDGRRRLRRLRLRLRQGARRAGRVRPEVLTCGQMLCAAGPMLAFAAIREGNPLAQHWTPLAVGCVLYLALAGSVGGDLAELLAARAHVGHGRALDGAGRAADRRAARRGVAATSGSRSAPGSAACWSCAVSL